MRSIKIILAILLFALLGSKVFSQPKLVDIFCKNDSVKININSQIINSLNKEIISNFAYPEMALAEGKDGVALLLIKDDAVINLNPFFNYGVYLETFNKYTDLIKKECYHQLGYINEILVIVDFYYPLKSNWNISNYCEDDYLSFVRKEIKHLDDIKDLSFSSVERLGVITRYNPLNTEVNNIWFEYYKAKTKAKKLKSIDLLIEKTKNMKP